MSFTNLSCGSNNNVLLEQSSGKTQVYWFKRVHFLKWANIHPDIVQSADTQATLAGAFSQMGFLRRDFHCVFTDR